MLKITVYEKPTCTTCRKLNKLFEANGIDWKKINYFIEAFTEKKLTELLKKTNLRPYEVLRRAEPDLKGLGITADTPDAEVIKAMVQFPSIIQRPIVEIGDKAVLARPIVGTRRATATRVRALLTDEPLTFMPRPSKEANGHFDHRLLRGRAPELVRASTPGAPRARVAT